MSARSEALHALLKELREILGPGAEHEAQQLLEHVLDSTPAGLHAGDRAPSVPERSLALELARRRSCGEPLQYLIGWVPFLDARIEVGPGVLVPRVETEFLAETALQLWRDLGLSGTQRALDVGTGSGCLAVGMAVAEPRLHFLALDISEEAVSRAAANAAGNGVEDRVEARASDLFSWLRESGEARHAFSLVISNPPYVSLLQKSQLPRDVVEHEPHVALFSGESGTEHLERIVREAPHWLARPGLLALEIGETQQDNALALLRETGAFRTFEVREDLTRRARMAFAWR